MNDDYDFHLNAPGSMVSNSLKQAMTARKARASEASPPDDQSPAGISFTVTAEGVNDLSSRRVMSFLINEESCKTGFIVSKEKMIKAQAFYGKPCSVRCGEFSIDQALCTEWEYTTVAGQALIAMSFSLQNK
jgi:hypothetical protein